MNRASCFRIVLLMAFAMIAQEPLASAHNDSDAGVEQIVWPDTPAARWAHAYVTAYNIPGEEALNKFITDRFSKAELGETPVKEMVAQYFQPRRMGLERLDVQSVRTDGDLIATVVAPAKPYGWIEFRFELSPEAPHTLIGLKIGPTRPPDAENRTAHDYLDWTDLGDLVEQVRRDSGAPGIAVATVRHGQVVDKAVAGVRRIDRRDRVQIGDRFHLGSVAKSFTATMIGKLVEEGTLRWDSSVGEVLHDIPMNPAFRAVTLEQLLQHRGGVPPMPSAAQSSDDKLATSGKAAAEARAATVRQILTESPSKPGEYAYSNAGYVVAASMAERAAKEPWETLMQGLVFEPLKLHSAGFGWPAHHDVADHVDQPEGHIGTPPNLEVQQISPGSLDDLDRIGPAGHLYCSIEDLARFAAAHLQGLRGHDGVLKASTVRRLHTPPEGGHYMGGWVIREAEGWHGHEGTAGTFFAEITLYPDDDLAIVAAANCGPSVEPFLEKMKEAIVRSTTSEAKTADVEPQVEWPDTIAAHRAKAFIDAMNAGDEGSLHRFVTENYSPASLQEDPTENKVAMFQSIRAPMGTLKVSSARMEGEDRVIVVAMSQNTGIWLALTIQLEEEPPHYWAGVRALPTAPP